MVWAGAGPNLGSILGEGDIAHPVPRGSPLQTAHGLVQRVARPTTVPVAPLAAGGNGCQTRGGRRCAIAAARAACPVRCLW